MHHAQVGHHLSKLHQDMLGKMRPVVKAEVKHMRHAKPEAAEFAAAAAQTLHGKNLSLHRSGHHNHVILLWYITYHRTAVMQAVPAR